jgi:hypothetical protein
MNVIAGNDLFFLFFLDMTGIFVADSLTGMAAVTFILVNDCYLTIHFLVYVSRAGVHTLSAIGTLIPVNGHFPHG